MKTKNDNQALHLRLRVLHAIDYPEIAEEFQFKHSQVLERLGVKGAIKSACEDWWKSDGRYIFITEHTATSEIIAGMRIDVRTPKNAIPAEAFISHVRPHFFDQHEQSQSLAECCAWWVDANFAKRDLPLIMLRSGVAIASKLRITSLLGFAHQYTIKIMEDVGFKVVNDQGLSYSFIYPDHRYTSTVVRIKDTLNLTDLPEHQRNQILDLRHNPTNEIRYEVNGLKTHLEYDLRIA